MKDEEKTEVPQKEPLIEDKVQDSSSLEETKVSTQGISEPEAEDADELHSKYLLLDRLFKFIRTKSIPLNAVLSGYFAKLVTLLINRR